MSAIRCTILANMCWGSVIETTQSMVPRSCMELRGRMSIQPKRVGSCLLYTSESCAFHSFHTRANTCFGMPAGNGQGSLASNLISRIRAFNFGERNYVLDGLQQQYVDLESR